jgi:hypothetical protein
MTARSQMLGLIFRKTAWTLLFAAIFAAYAGSVFNQFLYSGTSNDPVYLASMIWHGDFALSSPPVMTKDPVSFYATHFSPILTLPALISFLLPLDFIAFFSLLIGSFHLAANLVFSRIAMRAIPSSMPPSGAFLIPYAATAIFAFGFLQFCHTGIPHFEILLVAGILLFLHFYLQDKLWPAILALVACFLIREDAGLHIAALLAVSGVHKRFFLRQSWTMEACFAAASVLGSLLLLENAQTVANSQNMLRGMYIGDPPFAHITTGHIADRLRDFFVDRGYIWAPIAACVFGAACLRRISLLVAPVAVMPWLVLHLIFCTQPTGGSLSFYYSFPVLIVPAWPFLCAYRQETGRTGMLLVGLAAAIAGFMPPLADMPERMAARQREFPLLPKENPAKRQAYFLFVERYRENKAALGVLHGNMAALGFGPHVFEKAQLIEPQTDASRLTPNMDTLLFFDSPLRCRRMTAYADWVRGAPHRYRIVDTRLFLVTEKSPEDVAPFRDLMHPVPLAHICAEEWAQSPD